MTAFLGALVGFLSGAFFGMLGFAKRQNVTEPFDVTEFASTIAISAVAGAVIGWSGGSVTETDLGAAVTFLSAYSVDAFIKGIVKAIRRRLLKK